MTLFIKIKKHYLLILVVLLAFGLRFYKLSSNPASLYWEEAALGYDAYSLLKTGKDHRGNGWPVVYLESFMDFKPPLYIYTVLPSIAVFGLNEFGVRFPSAFFGSLTVILIYFLSKELFNKPYLALTASFLLAISPWHLQFSRPAFEASLALFLVTSGSLFFLKAFKKNAFLILSAFCFSLSLYAYHGARVFSFFLILSLTLIYFKKVWLIKKEVLITSFLLGLLIALPLIRSLNSPQVRQRFQETSVFTSLDPILESNRKIERDGGGIIAKLVHHRFVEYSRLFLIQYFKHWQGDYLFLSGDENRRHSTQEFGQLYHWELVSLILGLVLAVKNLRKKNLQLILSWLFLAPIPGSITKAAPHSLRTIFALPAFVLVSGLGLVQLVKFMKSKKIWQFCFCLVVLIELGLYLRFYYHHYPKLYSPDWQYGYKQAVSYIKEREGKYDAIYLTNNYGRAYMYYLFFSQFDPYEAQELIKPFNKAPNIPKIDKVFFEKERLEEGKQLFVVGPGEIGEGRLMKTIEFLDGEIAFEIREKK